jgi:hypothetical protein
VEFSDLPFCPSCGRSYEGEFTFCPHCGKALTSPIGQVRASPVQTTSTQKSHIGRNLGIALVLLLLFFFLPVFPYTFYSGSYAGVNVQATADVSLSFAAFHCGMVVNVQISGSFLGYNAGYTRANPGFVCNGNG